MLKEFSEGGHTSEQSSVTFLQQNAATLFEQACNERIQQLDDQDSDEDLWEEKEITFSSTVTRPRLVACIDFSNSKKLRPLNIVSVLILVRHFGNVQ